MYNTSYIMMEEFYIMEEIKRLVYSRELRWNEILVIAMRLFRENIKVIAAGMLVIGLPLSILLTLIQSRVLSLMEFAEQVSLSGMALSPQESINLIQQMMTNNVLLMAVTVFLEPIFIIGVAKAAKWRLEGRRFSASKAFVEAMSLEPVVVKVGIVYMILFLLGTLLVIPAIYLGVVWCLYLYCIALGGRRSVDALGHSRVLVRSRWWRTFGFLIILAAISYCWNSVLSLIFMLFPDNFAVNCVYTCITYLTQGFVVSATAILFLNRESGLFGMASLQEPEEVQEAEGEKAE